MLNTTFAILWQVLSSASKAALTSTYAIQEWISTSTQLSVSTSQDIQSTSATICTTASGDTAKEQKAIISKSVWESLFDNALKKIVMSEYKLKKTKVEEKVVDTYKKIEDGVVNAYKNVEDAVVGTYKKIEGKFVDKFLDKE